MKLLSTIVLCTLCAIASTRPRQKRMVGADFASRKQFPYAVLVRRPGYECTGSIITPSWVLTAAHCISNTNAARFKITAGTISDWKGGDERDQFVQHRRATRAIAHESYARFTNESIDTTFYDIGLLQLKKPFKMTKYVSTVELTPDPPPYVTPCTAIGFGSSTISPEDWEKLKEDPTHGKRTKRSEPLRYYKIGESQYTPPDYGPLPCRVLRDFRFKENYQLCSIGGAPNTTHLYVGDSGGPLVCNGNQVGVYVLSEPKMYNGSLHIIEVHTAVHRFIPWMKKYIPDLHLPNENDVLQSNGLDTMQSSGKWLTGTNSRNAFATQGDPQNKRTRYSPSRMNSAKYSESNRDEIATQGARRNTRTRGNPIRTNSAKFSESNTDERVVFPKTK